MKTLFDVVAVSADDSRILWVEKSNTKDDAEAIVSMAVMRQGVADRFFTLTAAGKYQKGDTYSGDSLEKEGKAEPEAEDRDYFVVGGMMFPRGPRGL